MVDYTESEQVDMLFIFDECRNYLRVTIFYQARYPNKYHSNHKIIRNIELRAHWDHFKYTRSNCVYDDSRVFDAFVVIYLPLILLVFDKWKIQIDILKNNTKNLKNAQVLSLSQYIIITLSGYSK